LSLILKKEGGPFQTDWTDSSTHGKYIEQTWNSCSCEERWLSIFSCEGRNALKHDSTASRGGGIVGYKDMVGSIFAGGIGNYEDDDENEFDDHYR